MNSSQELAYLVVKALQFYSIGDVVISPGSRNAPLVNQLTQIGDFNCISCVDERAAGFKALGISLRTLKPTVLICTSGTALLNYAPAICEAYYQGVPLVVISADRPEKWIDQGDGQTIRQLNALGSYVVKSQQLNAPVSADEIWLLQRKIGDIFCMPEFVEQKRPIHLNCAFDEPLYRQDFNAADATPNFRIPFSSALSKENPVLNELAEKANKAKKVLWIIGQMDPNTGKAANDYLNQIKSFNQHVLIAETTSNVFVHDTACIDRNIVAASPIFDGFQPEMLIHIGGPIVSKKIKSLLRENSGKYVVRVHNTAFEEDTFKGLNLSVNTPPDVFLAQFTAKLQNQITSTYRELWTNHITQTKNLHSDFCKDHPYSDFSVFTELADLVPSKTHIFWANSSPIRYAQLFDYPSEKALAHYANRGTSGIEGVSSTANGFALKSKLPTLLVTGDVSFFYDINGLEDLPKNLKIILINNGGGNIFRIIDGPASMISFEEFLETNHQKNAKHLAAHFGINYSIVRNKQSLRSEISNLFNSEGPSLLEVFTPRLENANILKNYFRYVTNN